MDKMNLGLVLLGAGVGQVFTQVMRTGEVRLWVAMAMLVVGVALVIVGANARVKRILADVRAVAMGRRP